MDRSDAPLANALTMELLLPSERTAQSEISSCQTAFYKITVVKITGSALFDESTGFDSRQASNFCVTLKTCLWTLQTSNQGKQLFFGLKT